MPRQRERHDGLTPERQLAFVEALAASGCVSEACAAAGISRSAAYALRTSPRAQAFRMAWDAALDLGIRALTDACFARAIQGEAVPRYYQGEKIGEHRRYDNRLAMFLLRYRDPLRYAASLDQMVYSGHPERAGVAFAKARHRLMDEAHGETPPPDESAGALPFEAEPIAVASDRAAEEALIASNAPVGGSYERRERIRALRHERRAQEQKKKDADFEAWQRDFAVTVARIAAEGAEEDDEEQAEGGSDGDVVSTLSGLNHGPDEAGAAMGSPGG